MKIIQRNVSQEEDVWPHWCYVQDNIRDPLLNYDLIWHLCEIEEKDLDQLFIISSGDWWDISGNTFLVRDVVNCLNNKTNNPDTKGTIKNIKEHKIKILESGGDFRTKPITVTNCPDLGGPFTLVDGNKRSVALCKCNKLVGYQIFVGTSPCIRYYRWAENSFK